MPIFTNTNNKSLDNLDNWKKSIFQKVCLQAKFEATDAYAAIGDIYNAITLLHTCIPDQASKKMLSDVYEGLYVSVHQTWKSKSSAEKTILLMLVRVWYLQITVMERQLKANIYIKTSNVRLNYRKEVKVTFELNIYHQLVTTPESFIVQLQVPENNKTFIIFKGNALDRYQFKLRLQKNELREGIHSFDAFVMCPPNGNGMLPNDKKIELKWSIQVQDHQSTEGTLALDVEPCDPREALRLYKMWEEEDEKYSKPEDRPKFLEWLKMLLSEMGVEKFAQNKLIEMMTLINYKGYISVKTIVHSLVTHIQTINVASLSDSDVDKAIKDAQSKLMDEFRKVINDNTKIISDELHTLTHICNCLKKNEKGVAYSTIHDEMLTRQQAERPTNLLNCLNSLCEKGFCIKTPFGYKVPELIKVVMNS